MRSSVSAHGQKIHRAVILAVCLLLLGCFTGWLIHSNRVPWLTEITVSSERLPASFEGFRIVQISDLHDAEYGEGHAGTLALIREAEPDIIVLTGDLVDASRTDVEQSIELVRRAVEIAPCYYVTGNHEGRLSSEAYADLEAALLSLGVIVLHDEAVTLERGGETITLAGVDSPAFAQTPADLPALCGDGFTILLAHHPEYATTYAEAGADLVFSGHAHGGQFRLPFVGGIYAPGQGLFPTYDAGLYPLSSEAGTTYLVVSRGLGNSAFPVRVGNRPEVILVVLERD